MNDLFDLSVAGSSGFLFEDRTALTAQLPEQAEGEQTYNLVATDVAGNLAGTSLVVTYDFTAPASLYLDLVNDSGRSSTDNITNVSTPFMSFGSDDLINDRFDLSLDGSNDFLRSDSPAVTALLEAQPEGEQTYNLVARDVAGNESTTTLDVTYDFTAPASVYLNLESDSGRSSTDNITNVSMPFVSFGSDDLINDRFDLSRAGSSGLIRSDSPGVTALLPVQPEGTQTYSLVAKDVAGNETATTLDVTYDFTAPQAPPTPDLLASIDSGVSDSDNILNRTPNIDFLANSPDGLLDIYRDGVLVSNNAMPGVRAYGNNETGSQDFEVFEIDIAGNVGSDSSTLTVLLDFENPVAEIVPVSPDYRNTSVDIVYVNMSDVNPHFQPTIVHGLEVSDFTLTRDGTVVPLTTQSVGFIGNTAFVNGLESVTSAEGEYILTLDPSSVIDTAGNELDGSSVLETTWVNTSSYQNPRIRWDVNDNGAVSPLDALLVINALVRYANPNNGEVQLSDVPFPIPGQGEFLDVNGSGTVTALDANHVITQLGQAANGEGEFPANNIPFNFGIPITSGMSHLNESINGTKYYEFEAATAGTLNIDALFSHADGDINMIVYRFTDLYNPIVVDSFNDNESVSLTAALGERFAVALSGNNTDVDLHINIV